MSRNAPESESESPQDELAKVEERYGFSVENDIFGSLGKGMLMYLLPLKGVVSVPGMALVVDLEDPAAMQKGIEGLMKMLAEDVGETFTVKAKPYKDAPVWTFNFEQDESGEGMNPLLAQQFSPSIAIVKGRLLVTLNLLHMKKEIRRALGEETGVHMIATEGHLPPADATAFAYMDWPALLNGLYTGGRGAAGFIPADSLPVDISKLPEPGVFTRFYRPTIYYSRTIPNGTYLRNESSFGPEVWLGLLGIGAVAAVGVSNSQEIASDNDSEPDIEQPDEVEPVPKSPATGVPSTETGAAMRHIATSVAVYQMDVGKYPATLAGLLTPTKNYPDGFIGKAGLPNDGWGRGFKYTLLENGARYRLWSTGPDGLDQQGAGDDIVSP